MNPCVKFLAGLACVSAVVATPVRAQDDACVIDQNAPQFVGRAFFAVQKGIATLNNNGDPATDARTAVRLLTDPNAPDRSRNPAGQAGSGRGHHEEEVDRPARRTFLQGGQQVVRGGGDGGDDEHVRGHGALPSAGSGV